MQTPKNWTKEFGETRAYTTGHSMDAKKCCQLNHANDGAGSLSMTAQCRAQVTIVYATQPSHTPRSENVNTRTMMIRDRHSMHSMGWGRPRQQHPALHDGINPRRTADPPLKPQTTTAGSSGQHTKDGTGERQCPSAPTTSVPQLIMLPPSRPGKEQPAASHTVCVRPSAPQQLLLVPCRPQAARGAAAVVAALHLRPGTKGGTHRGAGSANGLAWPNGKANMQGSAPRPHPTPTPGLSHTISGCS